MSANTPIPQGTPQGTPQGKTSLTEQETIELGIKDLLELQDLPAIDAANIGVTRMVCWFRNGNGKPEYRAESALRTSWLLAKATGIVAANYGADDEVAFRNVLCLCNLKTLKDNNIPQILIRDIVKRHLQFGDVWSNIRQYTPQNDPTTTRLYVEAAEEVAFEMDVVGLCYSKLMLTHHPKYVPSAELNLGCKIDN